MSSSAAPRIILVTGGTRGIGAACVRRLAADGAHVVFTGRDVEAGRALAAEVAQTMFVSGDASVEVDCRQAVQAALDLGNGAIAGLVNNAGTSARMAFDQASVDDWNRIMTVNATSAFLFTRHAMRVCGRGGARW